MHSTMNVEEFDDDHWSSIFDGVIGLLEESERQYGFSNRQFAEYILERLDLLLSICRSLKIRMESFREDFQNCIESLQELLDSLVFIRFKWMEYGDNLESRVNSSYQVSVVRGNGRGRPRFEVSKEQIEYLVSLSFSYSEIASLLGVSRSTIFR